MKYLFYVPIFFLSVSACKSIKVISKAGFDEPGTYYYLPKTIIQIDVESSVYKKQSGKFSIHSEEMLGVKPYSDTIEYKPSKIEISTTAVPDDKALFLVKSSCRLSLGKTSSGIIKSVNARADEPKQQITSQKINDSKERNEGDEVLVFYKRPHVVPSKHLRKIKRDTSTTDTLATEEIHEILKATSDPVYDSAVVYQTKLQELESLLSDYTDCENCENGASAKTSLNHIKKRKEDYIRLFKGSIEKSKISQEIIIDEKILSALKTEKEIKIIKDDLLRKNNLMVTITVMNQASVSAIKEGESGFAYRIPTTVSIKVIDTKTKNTLVSEIRDIALPGSDNVSTLSKKSRKIIFDTETGAVLRSE